MSFIRHNYEGPNLANQNSRKLEVYDRKLEGNHSLFYSYHAKYQMVNYPLIFTNDALMLK